jgi:hypothetical protein
MHCQTPAARAGGDGTYVMVMDGGGDAVGTLDRLSKLNEQHEMKAIDCMQRK